MGPGKNIDDEDRIAVDTRGNASVIELIGKMKGEQRRLRKETEAQLGELAALDRHKWIEMQQANAAVRVTTQHTKLKDLKAALQGEENTGGLRLSEDGREIRDEAGRAVAEVKTGNERFVPVETSGAEALHTVYQKLGTGKEYVKDARGEYVKRVVTRIDRITEEAADHLRQNPSHVVEVGTFSEFDKRELRDDGGELVGTAIRAKGRQGPDELRNRLVKGMKGVEHFDVETTGTGERGERDLERAAMVQNTSGGHPFNTAISTTASKHEILGNHGQPFSSVPGGAATDGRTVTLTTEIDLAKIPQEAILKGYDVAADPEGLETRRWEVKSTGPNERRVEQLKSKLVEKKYKKGETEESVKEMLKTELEKKPVIVTKTESAARTKNQYLWSGAKNKEVYIRHSLSRAIRRQRIH
ncbi:hypothetical protein [Marinibactrum halimedae]|uniref:Uncharacterized protein n=1 Tax=Marinibactrum halimedae TaxID=1444977 RepID=A0AA37WKH8_9GAMM|nr:hypothetical protein [Marinibactrum halimedae]MCD9458075.1 hypothetical protein [Marinibactrum halimedae]GLS25008.1 hypothetical protein GCM10007877_07220 [Marinibactrum halimedae]